MLKNNSNHYIVSDGFLRKFENIETLAYFGYTTENFQKVDATELKYNPT